MEQPDLSLMHFLAKAMEPSGWMMWPVLAQSHPWTNVSSVDGASTIVGIMKMQESCAKVGMCVCTKMCVLCIMCDYVAFVHCMCTMNACA